MRILYIHPEEARNQPFTLSGIIRISNFLNSKKKKISQCLEEEFIDLKFEGLPKFTPENISEYREKLTTKLLDVFSKFQYDIVAISCYSVLYYLNSIEIAYAIKSNINKECITIVGGGHPSITPNEFFPENIPIFYHKIYSNNIIPFNFIIKGEGEIGFYNVIKKISNSNKRLLCNTSKVVHSEIIENLDSLPIIDFSLFYKYKKSINEGKVFLCLDSGRGCMYTCSFCITSTDTAPCYKNFRSRSVENTIKDLEVIYDTAWLSPKYLGILDPIFFPHRKQKESFFEQYRKFKKDTNTEYGITIFDRIDHCTQSDLKNYKELILRPEIGLESVSIPTLKIIGKLYSKKDEDFILYIKRAEKLIKISNNFDIDICLNYLLGLPSEPHIIMQNYKDFYRFFFKKRFNGKSLMDKFRVFIWWALFTAQKGTRMFVDCEERYGGKIYYKNWWRVFDERQREYCKVVRPHRNVSLPKIMLENIKLIERVFKNQSDRGLERFYSESYINYCRTEISNILNIYNQIKKKENKNT